MRLSRMAIDEFTISNPYSHLNVMRSAWMGCTNLSCDYDDAIESGVGFLCVHPGLSSSGHVLSAAKSSLRATFAKAMPYENFC